MSSGEDAWGSPAYMVLYVLGAVSVCCSCYVVFCILKFSALRVVITRLILYLHITLIMEDIVSMPFSFDNDNNLCKAMGFLWTYTALSRVFVVSCLVVIYRNIFFPESLISLNRIVSQWSEIIVFIAPAIPACTPFITNSFGDEGTHWCAIINGSQANYMAFVSLYGWAWLFITLTASVLVWTVVEVYRVDSLLTSKLVSTVGMYVVVAILSWIPRTEARLYRLLTHSHYTGFYVDTIVLYASGLVYLLVFLSERKGITRFDTFSQSLAFRPSDSDVQDEEEEVTSSPRYVASVFSDSVASTERNRSFDNLIPQSSVGGNQYSDVGYSINNARNNLSGSSCYVGSDTSSGSGSSVGEKALLESLLKV